MVNTPFEQTLEADTALILDDPLGPAITVILQDGDGGEHELRALYAEPPVDAAPGASHAPALSTAPLLHIPVAAITHAIARPLSNRDHFLVRGRRYRAQSPRPDGYGMIACKLMEAADA